MKYFSVFSLGCRVNAAETNLFAQTLINKGYETRHPRKSGDPSIIFINTCSVTAKANVESLGLIRRLQFKFPKAQIIISGCADTQNIKNLKNITFIPNTIKESKLNILKSLYDPTIGDKFSHTHRYLLKVQSGCTDAINTVNQVVKNGYREIIITGVNLNQYAPGFSNLLEALLTKTKIPLISFGSIPLLCIDNKFLNLYKKFSTCLSHFLHIPIQSGSNKILKLMNRPYDNLKIKKLIKNCKLKIKNLSLGTDIIVAFPGETESDFKETLSLCKNIGFQKIHTFRFSPRDYTPAQLLFKKAPQISKSDVSTRAELIRQLCIHQT